MSDKINGDNKTNQQLAFDLKESIKKTKLLHDNTICIKESTENIKVIVMDNNKFLKILIFIVGILFLLSMAFCIFGFLDFEAPQIIVTNLKATENGSYEVRGGYERFVLDATDNDEIARFILNSNDIRFDGFSCIKSLKNMPDGTYLLELFDVEKLSDNPRILINTGCAYDFNRNQNEQFVINLTIIENESSNKTVSYPILSKPKNIDNNKFVKVDSDLSFTIQLDDKIQWVCINLNNTTKEDYIHPVGFAYKELEVEPIDTNIFKCTFKGVTGSKGDHIIYLSAGLAEAGNIITQGTKSEKFYICEKETDLDYTRPTCSVFGPEYKEDGVVEYGFTCRDNKGINSINVSEDTISMYGFNADIEVLGANNADSNHRIIRFSNIEETQSSTQKSKYFTIDSRAVTDFCGNRTWPIYSPGFKMSELKQ